MSFCLWKPKPGLSLHLLSLPPSLTVSFCLILFLPGGLGNPRQMPERLFGRLRVADRKHSFKCKNKTISSRLCRQGMHDFIDRVGGGEKEEKQESYILFVLVWHFTSKFVNTKCFVRVVEHFCACHGEAFYPEMRHVHASEDRRFLSSHLRVSSW